MVDWNAQRIARTISDAQLRPATALAINEGSSFVTQLPGALPARPSINHSPSQRCTTCLRRWRPGTGPSYGICARRGVWMPLCSCLVLCLRCRCVLKVSGHVHRALPLGLGVSPCSRFLACASEDNSAIVYDVRCDACIAGRVH